VTPALIDLFQRTLRPVLKTHKLKGKSYSDAFTGKQAAEWVRKYVDGCSRTKAILGFCNSLIEEGTFQVVSGKTFSDKSSCVCQLK